MIFESIDVEMLKFIYVEFVVVVVIKLSFEIDTRINVVVVFVM